MTIAADTSLLLDVFSGFGPYVATSTRALRAAAARGTVVACAVVWAEIATRFPDAAALRAAMAAANVVFDPLDAACAHLAGQVWSAYRAAGGTRHHMLPDFLIGAHALRRGGHLLSRDSGFYRRYFRGLQVLS